MNLWNIRYFSPLFAVHCSFQNQVKFVFEGRDDEDRRSSLDSSSEVSIYLNTIIVNFDMQWGHAAAPFDVLAFSPLIEIHLSVYLKPVNHEADEMDLAVCAFIGDMPKAARKNW